MFKTSVYALALALIFSGAAVAQEKKTEGQTTIKIEDAADKKNKVEGNIDEEITNVRMRADSGSKSKWSLSTSLGYTGGAVARPFGVDRPNLAKEPGIQERTSANLGLDVRYRWSKSQSVTLGTSAGLMTPFQGDLDANQTQLNVFDPVVGYNLVGKIGKIQMNGKLMASAGTSQESKNIDKDAWVGASLTGLYAFQNRLTVGLSVSTGHSFYDTKPGQISNLGARQKTLGFYGNDARTEWSLGLFPFAEYAFNDTFQARTVFGYFNWRHLYGDPNRYRLLQTYVYQSVGVGISVSRDIYLYPNIQFVPDNIRSDFTNVALSATMNVF